MPFKSLVRIVSILAVVLIARRFGEFDYLAIVVSFGFSHYIVGFLYAGGRLSQAASRKETLIPLALFLLAGPALYRWNLPDIFFFLCLHVVLSDTYMMHSAHHGNLRLKNLFTVRLFFNAFAYIFMLRHSPCVSMVPAAVLGGAFLAAAGCFYYFLFRGRSEFTKREFTDQFLFESAAVVMAVCSLRWQYIQEYVTVYHGICWLFLPLPKLIKQGKAAVARFGLLNGGITAALFVMTPLGGGLFNIPIEFFQKQFNLWGYFHIMSSFALSSYNPAWLRKWFVPRPVLAVRESLPEYAAAK